MKLSLVLHLFLTQVSVLHNSEGGEHISHMVVPPQYMQVVHHPSMIHDMFPSHNLGKKTH